MDYFSGYEKNRRVNLFCKGGGLMKGSVILTQCIPSSVWVERKAEDYVAHIDNKIEEGDRFAVAMAVFVTAMHSFLPEYSSCYSSGRGLNNQCFSELQKYSDSIEFKNIVAALSKKYGDSVSELLVFDAALKKADDSQMGPFEGNSGPIKRE
jgi:hypothetical protein